MPYRIRNKIDGTYYVPGNASKYIDEGTGKVYEHLGRIKTHVIDCFCKHHVTYANMLRDEKDWLIYTPERKAYIKEKHEFYNWENWEVVEFHSSKADGEVVNV